MTSDVLVCFALFCLFAHNFQMVLSTQIWIKTFCFESWLLKCDRCMLESIAKTPGISHYTTTTTTPQKITMIAELCDHIQRNDHTFCDAIHSDVSVKANVIHHKYDWSISNEWCFWRAAHTQANIHIHRHSLLSISEMFLLKIDQHHLLLEVAVNILNFFLHLNSFRSTQASIVA